jgi:2-desacetyl-2-hydroxyethyl bacteriochlorophyllide A dehydrogenase
MKTKTMKAAVYTQYGSPEVLQLKEVAMPEPQANEILIRVKATAVNSGDVRLRKADPFAVRFMLGLTKPNRTILGAVYSGEVERTGKDVKLFKAGDQVFGHTDMKFGAYAEYICVSENGTVALKPGNLNHMEAAAIPFGGTTALHFLKKANIEPGQKVLIVGASGAVGSSAVQLAKSFGAEVTGVCSKANMQMVKSIGADNVIDYTKEDFTQNGEMYDVIFDTVNSVSIARSIKSLKKKGKLILSAAMVPEMIKGVLLSLISRRDLFIGVISHNADAINFLKNLVETGKLKPVIDKTYPLDQIQLAHAYVEKGHKKGNVTINIKPLNHD